MKAQARVEQSRSLRKAVPWAKQQNVIPMGSSKPATGRAASKTRHNAFPIGVNSAITLPSVPLATGGLGVHTRESAWAARMSAPRPQWWLIAFFQHIQVCCSDAKR